MIDSPRLSLVKREDGALALVEPDVPPHRGLTCAFDELLRRLGPHGLSKRDPLRRAFGDRVRSIVDATAGLGRDAFLLAMSGFEVVAIERSPLLFALVCDGLARLEHDAAAARRLGGRLRVLQGDARGLLPTIDPAPDAVFLDPMFPHKRKSALAKKSIRMVRDAVGDDADAPELFEVATRVALDRVVVKRSDDAPPLAPDPAFSIRSKLVRYDVYPIARTPSEGR